jgi:hypothetical protein
MARGTRRGHLPVAVVLGWISLAAPGVISDEARLRHGALIPGTLALAGGRLRFTPAGGGPPRSAGDVEWVRCAAAAPVWGDGPGLRVLLYDGQQLSGRLLQLDRDRLTLRTAWATCLKLPRAAVAAVTALPGWQLRFADDFTSGLAAWQSVGRPLVEGAPPAVILATAGQELSHRLDRPLAAGRLTINFEDRQKPLDGRWDLEAVFERPGQPPWVLTITVAGAGACYQVEAPAMAGVAGKVARTPGLHRLGVQFTPRSLRVGCEDAVLWYTLEQGPPGLLAQVRLVCRATEGRTPVQGRVAWSNCVLEQAVAELPRPAADSTQDEVWLEEGDQLFGTIVRADAHEVELQGRSRRLRLGWQRIRGCWLRPGTVAPADTTGAHVRLALAGGLVPEYDLLDGVLTAWDDREAVLAHAIGGPLRLPRTLVRQVWPLLQGRRLQLDNGFHHLGDVNYLEARLDPPRAEGTTWQAQFALPAVPPETRLVLSVVHLLGQRDPEGPVLAAGGLRTEVVVNGRVVDDLNAHVDRAWSRPRPLAVVVPRDALHPGTNTIALRQTPDPTTGRYAHCGIRGMALEMPEQASTSSP